MRTLVPSARSGHRALRSFNDSMSQVARLKKAAYGLLLGVGAGRLPSRLAGVESVGFTPGSAGGSDTIVDRIAGAVGRPVMVGVACGRELRPNRKPVLQVVDGRGEMVAFAKVGWNALTRSLVDAEAQALLSLARLDSRSFRVPSVIYHGDWEGRSLLVVSAGPAPLIRRCRRNAFAPVSVELEIAGSGWRAREELGASRYLAELRSRMTTPGLDPDTIDRATTQIDLMTEGTGSSSIDFGAWHGDFAPWNMTRAHGDLFVMDWERYAGPVPIGFDHLHPRFQLLRGAGRSVGSAASEAMASLRSVASRSGIAPGLAPLIMRLYLMEPLIRDQMGRAAGMATAGSVSSGILGFLEGGNG